MYNWGPDSVTNRCPPSPPACVDQMCGKNVGAPIDVTTGNMWHRETDLSLSSPLPLVLTRRYDSIDSDRVGGFGAGWRHSFEETLVCLEQDTVPFSPVFCTYINAENEKRYFARPETTDNNPPEDWIGHAPFVFQDGPSSEGCDLSVLEPDKTLHCFEKQGSTYRLKRIVDRLGNSLGIAYAGNFVAQVTDTFGRFIQLFPNSAGLIGSVAIGTPGPTNPGYFYTYAGNQLSTVTYPDGRTFHYGYQAPALLTSITDETPSGPRVLHGWGYDSAGRANLYYRGDGTVDRFTVDYSDWDGGERNTNTRVTRSIPDYSVVPPVNIDVTTTYHLDRAKRVVDNIYGDPTSKSIAGGPCPDCPNPYAESYTVDDNELTPPAIQRISERRDGVGNITRYEYGDEVAGHAWNITKITEAVGTSEERTTEICHDPEYNIPVRIAVRSTGSCNPGIGAGCANPDAAMMTMTRILDPQGNITNELVRYCDGNAPPKSRSTSYTYDAYGQVETVTGPRPGQVTSIDYFDSGAYLGWPSSVTLPVPALVTNFWEYDRFGQVELSTDPNVVATRREYDAQGRLLTEAIGDGTTACANNWVTTLAYDIAGHLQSVQRPAQCGTNFKTSFVEDSAGRLTDIVDPVGDVRHFQLDQRSQVTEETFLRNSAVKYRRSYLYDLFGRMSGVDYDTTACDNLVTCPPEVLSERFTHDANGDLASVTDSGGHVSLFEYDALRRLRVVHKLDEFGVQLSEIAYVYDVHDNLVQVRHPNQLVTTFTPDDIGQSRRYDNSDSGVTTYPLYDDAGNLLQSQDARGVLATRTYDLVNRLTSITYSAPYAGDGVTFVYDDPARPFGKGRLTSFTDPIGSGYFNYNPLGQITRESRPGEDTTYAYDKNGNVTTIGYPLTLRQVGYSYDSADRLQLVTSTVNSVVEPIATMFNYLPFGPAISWKLGQTLGGPLTVSRFFDRSYRLREHETTLSNGIDHAFWRAYGYGPDAQLGTVTDYLFSVSGNRTFTYDALHQLTEASSDSTLFGLAKWSYDASGNRQREQVAGTVTDFKYDDRRRKNRLTRTEATALSGPPITTSFTYDGAGNTTQLQTTAATTSYGYDGAGRLSTININPGVIGATHGYDYMGHVSRIILPRTPPPAADVDIFRYSGGALIDEARYRSSPASSQRSSYIWMLGQPVARIDQLTGTTDTVHFYHNDHLGAPLGTTTAAGDYTMRVEYEPFGRVSTVFPGSGPVVPDRLRFVGQFADTLASGLYQNWHRDYSPALGRYLTTDALNLANPSTPHSWSKYAYVVGNPFAFVDRNGREEVRVFDERLRYKLEQLVERSPMFRRAVSDYKGKGCPDLDIFPGDAGVDRLGVEKLVAFYRPTDFKKRKGHWVVTKAIMVFDWHAREDDFFRLLAHEFGHGVDANADYELYEYLGTVEAGGHNSDYYSRPNESSAEQFAKRVLEEYSRNP